MWNTGLESGATWLRIPMRSSLRQNNFPVWKVEPELRGGSGYAGEAGSGFNRRFRGFIRIRFHPRNP